MRMDQRRRLLDHLPNRLFKMEMVRRRILIPRSASRSEQTASFMSLTAATISFAPLPPTVLSPQLPARRVFGGRTMGTVHPLASMVRLDLRSIPGEIYLSAIQTITPSEKLVRHTKS